MSRPLRVIGLMSGTSADSIDAALCEIRGQPPHLQADILSTTAYAYPSGFQQVIHDQAAAERMYEVIGRELSAVGLNMLFAPCADCNSNPHNAIIGMRSFGESPDLVGRMTAAAVRGAMRGGVIASVKHFPGHGDTTLDSHRGLPTVSRSRAELTAVDLYPFAQGIQAGAEVVMTSHILYPALDAAQPATLSAPILHEVLRHQLGFDGVILSDSMNMQAMRQNYGLAQAEIAALKAGVDLIMLAEEHYNHDAGRYLDQQIAMLAAVAAAVRSGEIPSERIDDAVRRVLRLKARLGSAQQQAEELCRPDQVGTAENRAVELQVSQQAAAILRGAEDFHPLAAGEPLMVVNATARTAYEPIDKTRGIGPNQSTPAFDHFVDAVKKRTPHVKVLQAEDVLKDAALAEKMPVVAVSENYPLPGMDFDQSAQQPVITALAAQATQPVIVVALRDPYELSRLPGNIIYLCAFSFRPSAAQAAAAALFGDITPGGASPVSIAGTGITAIL